MCCHSNITHTMPQVRGLLWLAPDAPHSSCYVPFYSGGAAVPRSFSVGSQWEWGMDRNVAWWVFNFLSNYINTKYNIMHPIVAEQQNRLEEAFYEADTEVQASQLSTILCDLHVLFQG